MITSTIKPAVIAGTFAVCLAAMVLGVLAVPYGGWVQDNVVRIVALPAIMVLLFLLIADKGKLFLLIILIRAPIDPLVEPTRFGFLGLGAALNGLIILIALLFVLQQPRVMMRTALPMWAPLMLLAFVEAARSPELVTGIRTSLTFLSYAAVFTVPFYLKECRSDMRFCIYLVLLSSLVPAMYGFVELARGTAQYGRIESTFPHPNVFAFYLVLVISLAFYLLKSRTLQVSTLQRWLVAIYMAILLVLLVLTKTRGAWAACVAVFVVYGALFERRYLIYVTLVCALALLVPDVRERVADVVYGTSLWRRSSTSYEWRTVLWESAWDWMKLKDMPLGHGLASFKYYSPEFFPLSYGRNVGAHSAYVQWFFEAGLVGLACAAWLLFRLFLTLSTGFKQEKLRTVIVVAIVIAYLVASYSDNMLQYLAFNWYFWFVVGTACSVAVAGGNADTRRARVA